MELKKSKEFKNFKIPKEFNTREFKKFRESKVKVRFPCPPPKDSLKLIRSGETSFSNKLTKPEKVRCMDCHRKFIRTHSCQGRCPKCREKSFEKMKKSINER